MTTRQPWEIPEAGLSQAVPSPAKATAKRAPLPACAVAPYFDWRPQPTLRLTGDPNPRPERDSTSTHDSGPTTDGHQSMINLPLGLQRFATTARYLAANSSLLYTRW